MSVTPTAASRAHAAPPATVSANAHTAFAAQGAAPTAGGQNAPTGYDAGGLDDLATSGSSLMGQGDSPAVHASSGTGARAAGNSGVAGNSGNGGSIDPGIYANAGNSTNIDPGINANMSNADSIDPGINADPAGTYVGVDGGVPPGTTGAAAPAGQVVQPTVDDFTAISGISASDLQAVKDANLSPDQLGKLYETVTGTPFAGRPTSPSLADFKALPGMTDKVLTQIQAAGLDEAGLAKLYADMLAKVTVPAAADMDKWKSEYAAAFKKAGISDTLSTALLEQLTAKPASDAQLADGLKQLQSPAGIAWLKQQEAAAGAKVPAAGTAKGPVSLGVAEKILAGAGIVGVGTGGALALNWLAVKAMIPLARKGGVDSKTAKALSHMPGGAAERARQTLNIGEKSSAIAVSRAELGMSHVTFQEELKAIKANGIPITPRGASSQLRGVKSFSLEDNIRFQAAEAKVPGAGTRPVRQVMDGLAKATKLKVKPGETLESLATRYAESKGVFVTGNAATAIAAGTSSTALGEAKAISSGTGIFTHPVKHFRNATNAAKVRPSTLAMSDAKNMAARVAKGKAAFAAEFAESGGAKGLVGKAGSAFKGKAGIIGVGIGAAFEAPGIIASYKKEGGFGEQTSKKTGKAAGEIAGGYAGWGVGAELGLEGGAAIGTMIFPGVGTVIGGGVGAIIGGFAGSAIGAKVVGAVGEAVGGAVHGAISGIAHLFG